MELIYYPNKFLNKEVKTVDLENPGFDPKELKKEMVDFMLANNGIGLSANQIGLDAQVFVMGDKEDNAKRKILENYQVTSELINLAKDESIFLHCLPAHRGEEVTEEVIDGDKSFVWDEAENRVHAQKGIIDWCFS